MATTRDRRRFTRFDAIVLFFITALGAVVAKSIHDFTIEAEQMFDRYHSTPIELWRWATVPLFVFWSLTLLALRFRGTPARRVLRGPGIATGVVIALHTIRKLVEWTVNRLRPSRWSGTSEWNFDTFVSIASHLPFITTSAGLILAATWLALWLGRWWRPERDWIDRAGRVLGLYWVAMAFFELSRRLY